MPLRNQEFCPLDAHRLSMALCRQVLPCPCETQAVGVVVPTTDPVPPLPVLLFPMATCTSLPVWSCLTPPPPEPGGARRPCLAVCVLGERFTWVGVPLSRANPDQPSLVTLDRGVPPQPPHIASVSSLLRSFHAHHSSPLRRQVWGSSFQLLSILAGVRRDSLPAHLLSVCMRLSGPSTLGALMPLGF